LGKEFLFLVARAYEQNIGYNERTTCQRRLGSAGAHLHIVRDRQWNKLKQTLPVRLRPEPLFLYENFFFFLVTRDFAKKYGNVPRTRERFGGAGAHLHIVTHHR
jgi:hypothetical protein